MKSRHVLAVATGLVLLAGACGSSDGSKGATFDVPKLPKLDKLGAGEGALNIIAWAGYAEDGSTDPAYDWVHPFEDKTGCKVTVTNGATSDEMFTLLQGGGFDGVSASGDASLRMIAAGLVAPVNTDLIPNYKDIYPFLKDRTFNSANGQMYGVPHGWGANVLQFRTDVVTTKPDSWGVVFDPASPYAGKVTAYDSPIYIADAALYLMATKSDLGIKNPYSLDQKQFDAAVELLKQQKPLIGEYWSDYLKYEDAARAGSLVLGTSWQIITNTLQGEDPPVPVESVLPKEGSTGWFDTWMISAKAEHPNCMYMWMDWMAGPEAQSQVSTWFGEAPASQAACSLNEDMKAHCDAYHAADTAYADKIWGWTTPTTTCLDGRGDKCVPYSEWTKAWDEIKG